MTSATYFASAVKLDELPRDARPHVAMVGRSNAGKSSLINHLTSRKDLAHVSSSPGRTQTINLYEIDKKFFLVDLPGYGYAKKSLQTRGNFSEMIKDYLRHAKQLRLVLLIVDARTQSALDAEMFAWLTRMKIPFAIIVNKVDQLSKSEMTILNRALDKKYPGVTRIDHSVDSGAHRKNIWDAIDRAVSDDVKK